MRRPTLRRRLYTVLLQWFVLLVIAAGAVLAISFSGLHGDLVDDRLLLARTIAHSLDEAISAAIQNLGRLSSELPALNAEATGQLRAFRFQSPFREATYLLDAQGRIIAADPAGARPLPALSPDHETVTPLIQKPGTGTQGVVAIVQPFRRGGAAYYLVSEMNPVGSAVGAFLQSLEPEHEIQVAVIDQSGVVIAATDPRQLFRTLSHAAEYGERIGAHRPLVTERFSREFASVPLDRADMLTVMVPLRFAPWGVVVQQSRAKTFAGLDSTRRGLVLAGVMLAVVGVLLARALSRSVVAPIQALSAQAEAIRAGDLSQPIRVTGDHEVELLARTLDDARQRLASTLAELKALNEGLEQQVANRTRAIEARVRDLKLLQSVAQLSTQEHDPATFVPEMLSLIAAHYAFPALALVIRPRAGPAVTYVVPAGAAGPWQAGDLPPDWQRREIAPDSQLQAELFHPRVRARDEEVMAALEHQLAISLHGAYLWQQTVAQDEQRGVLLRRLLNATEEERRRLARELHDEISQLLTAIQLSLEHVEVDSPEMKRARGLLVEAQKEMHRIIYDLRPSLLDDLGLPAAIQSHAQDHLARRGVTVSVEIEDELPARAAIDTTIFRIYQELMTNILRHAEAEHVSVELYERAGKRVLAVEDDGKGFDVNEKFAGAGITGMRERATLVNGTIRFDSEPGLGTHVMLEIPVG
jgi:signal transduction histidine kinase/HAMP domain-containing protein